MGSSSEIFGKKYCDFLKQNKNGASIQVCNITTLTRTRRTLVHGVHIVLSAIAGCSVVYKTSLMSSSTP